MKDVLWCGPGSCKGPTTLHYNCPPSPTVSTFSRGIPMVPRGDGEVKFLLLYFRVFPFPETVLLCELHLVRTLGS